jgi:hypothetical protein
MYEKERSESRQANYLYLRVLSCQDSVAFPFLVHLAKTMLWSHNSLCSHKFTYLKIRDNIKNIFIRYFNSYKTLIYKLILTNTNLKLSLQNTLGLLSKPEKVYK